MTNEDDRFADVAEQLKQTEDGIESDDSKPTDSETESRPNEELVTGNAESETQSTTEQNADEMTESAGGPAFSFDETDMHGFYVREETWNDVTRMQSLVAAVCSIFDAPEFEGREFQDACLQVIAEHGDEVALQILRERGIEADEDRVQEVVEILNKQATND